MKPLDPTIYIFTAALLGFALGFVASSLMTARTVRRANLAGWREASEYFKHKHKKDEQ